MNITYYLYDAGVLMLSDVVHDSRADDGESDSYENSGMHDGDVTYDQCIDDQSENDSYDEVWEDKSEDEVEKDKKYEDDKEKEIWIMQCYYVPRGSNK